MFFDNDLYHYGVKGMKWGVRRKSKISRDSRKLSDAATKYYTESNRRNAYFDLDPNDTFIPKYDKEIEKGKRKVQKLVKKMEKKYGSGNVSVLPEFEKNGYIVKSAEAVIRKVDRQGRLTNEAKSYSPVDTYSDYRKTAKRVNEARKPIDAKYKKRLKEAKTDDEREYIQMEYDDELDRLMYGD